MTPETFTAVADLFPEPALLLTGPGAVCAANIAATEFFGAPAGTLRGRSLTEFAASPAGDLADYLRACSRTRQRVPGAVTLRDATGRTVAFRADGCLVCPATEGAPAIVLVRLMRKEEAVTQFVALTERVEQLSAEIARRKQAEAELRAAARHKDEFLALLAHELRNPLVPILTGIEVLGTPGANDTARARSLEMMRRQVRFLTHMLDDLLDVARVTQGKVQLARTRADLALLARAAVADHRARCDARGVTVTLDSPDTPVWVNGDPTRLTQIVANLFLNACKFTDSGGRVAVRVAAAGTRAEVQVRDTGAGLDPAILSRLFEPFAQADRTLDRAGGGLGLGLALAKGLAELHGGGLTAHSEGAGRGSEFIFWMPLESEPPALAGVPPSGTAGGRRRVLIIEDNRDAADSLKMLLEVLGHEVRAAHTGPDGVREAVAWRPDVVVCDIGLPGLDGYGVAGELERLSVRSTARLIALTGYGDEESRDRAARAGFHHHLTKPADPTALLKLFAG